MNASFIADPVAGGPAPGLRALGLAGRLAVRGLSVAAGRRLSILIFHRVLPQADPMFPDELDARRFDTLMAVVARSFQVLPLADAVQRLAHDKLPPRALSITFDDGYADNHDVALPILQRHGLPACFFIATGFLGGGRMFNDTVIETLRHSPLPRVDLADFGLGRFALQTPAQRTAAVQAVLPGIKYLAPEQRPQALERLQHLCQPRHLPDDLMMLPAQVQALHKAGMEIGAHTVRHPILCSVADAVAEREITDSRQHLQGLLDSPVSLFAYPNGRPDRDYAGRHAALVRRLGFAAAVSTAPGTADNTADPFQLPRFTPWDHAPARWMARLIAMRRARSFSLAGEGC
ncbi:MAG: polysaccharide deacetylase family protein [Pseudomonadota bacterium]